MCYFIPVDKNNFQPDQLKLETEFYETRWMKLDKAKKVIKDKCTLEGISYIQNNLFKHK
jgi:hypothetical protein